jgi:SAM-dependent methyltransferase
MTEKTTAALYDEHAADWARDQRLLLSDFTARPRVVEALEPAGKRALDLGCGEGYVARLVAQAGASFVIGFDSSTEMIERARRAVPTDAACPMMFETADVTRLTLGTTYDCAMAVFLFNYLTRAEMEGVLRVVRRSIVPGGRFVFTVPHPCFPYMRKVPMPSEVRRELQQQVRLFQQPFYFNTGGLDYFAGVDRTYEGEIWRRDGVAVPVRCVHKTWADYFDALESAGFTRTPKVVELHVTDEHVEADPAFFEPLRGYPLHVLFRVEVP